MEKRKLLSVVVPTKDRYQYLKFLIDLIAGFHSDELELVIQDNSDNNSEFVEYIGKLQYDFIRYNHIHGQIPMAENADRAILNSSGEYVCFLGDDDGLTKYTIDCARWMKINGIDAVKSASIFYYWPDITQSVINTYSAVLQYNSFDGNIVFYNSDEELLKLLKKGITDRGNLPLVYHSLVSRTALDKIYEKVGTYFPGNSPDISNAVALSLTIKKFASINMPLAYSGWSKYAGGGVNVSKKNKYPLITEIPWFMPNPEERWEKRIPKIGTSGFIWADSAISALRKMGRDDLYNKVNFNKMYANFAISNPDLKYMVKDVCVNKLAFYNAYILGIMNKYINAIVKRIGWRLKLKEKPIIERNINNVIEATSRLEQISESIKCDIK